MLRRKQPWYIALLLMLVACGVSVRQAPSVNAAPPSIGGCNVFPADNVWNTSITTLPVAKESAAYVASIGADAVLKADWGAGLYNGGPIGIPFTTVGANQPSVPVSFEYADESDPGPYPIPPDAPIEGGADASGDRHVLVVDTNACTLYELYAAYPQRDGSWNAGSGAKFDLRSNQLRPRDWTSADAAGLPILAGLARYDEVQRGVIPHALRFTASATQRAYVWPARHFASDRTDADLPPMGQRFRLRASFDISHYSPSNQVILTALKTYGMLLADNGAPWFISGVPDERWNNDELRELAAVKGSAFEAVDASSLIRDENSGTTATAPLTALLWLPRIVR